MYEENVFQGQICLILFIMTTKYNKRKISTDEGNVMHCKAISLIHSIWLPSITMKNEGTTACCKIQGLMHSIRKPTITDTSFVCSSNSAIRMPCCEKKKDGHFLTWTRIHGMKKQIPWKRELWQESTDSWRWRKAREGEGEDDDDDDDDDAVGAGTCRRMSLQGVQR